MTPFVRHVRAAAAGALLLAVTGCTQVSEPVTTETWVLDRLNGQALPATLDRSTHRSLEVVSGTLVLHSDGRARATQRVRVTDAGAEPVEMLEEVEGRWERSTGRVVVTLADGYVHTFQELTGERLRTTATRCTRDCAMATSILHIFEFHRAVVVGQAGG